MNKYNIQIMSKHEAVLYDMKDIKEDTIVISINCPNENTHVFKNPKIIETTYVYFDDLTEEQVVKHNIQNITLMNLDQAKDIKESIDRNPNIYNIIVHCAMGVSRSGAVGCVLARYLNGDDLYLFNKGKYNPNELCYKLMCEAFNLEFNKDDFKRKCKLSSKVCEKQLGKIYSDYGLTLDDVFKID